MQKCLVLLLTTLALTACTLTGESVDIAPTTTQIPAETPSESVINYMSAIKAIPGWQTYQNTEKTFKIQHPPNWTIRKDTSANKLEISNPNTRTTEQNNGNGTFQTPPEYVYVQSITESSLTPTSIWESEVSGFTDNETQDIMRTTHPFTKIRLAYYEGVQYKYMGANDESIVLVFSNGRKIARLHTSLDKPVDQTTVKQIISSFEML